MTKAMNTPRIVAVCETPRPTLLPPRVVPNRPAMSEPASGASGTTSSWEAERVEAIDVLALQHVQFDDRNAVLVAEQQDQDREADRAFGGGHGEDEELEHLAVHVAQVVRERHEVHVDGQEHEL